MKDFLVGVTIGLGEGLILTAWYKDKIEIAKLRKKSKK